jgi:hypothetical protein
MKRTIASLVILAAALGFGGKSFAQSSGPTFYVSNQQSENVGTVTVTDSSGNYYVSAPGNSTDSVTITNAAISVMIYGQTVPQGQKAYITLPDQTVVGVLWQSPNCIVVVDKDEIE